MLLIIFLIFLLIIIILDYVSKRKRITIAKDILGLPHWPIIGNGYIFRTRNAKDAAQALVDLCDACDGLSKVWIFNRLLVIMSRPEDAEHIMNTTKHIKKNFFYDILKAWLGDGLLISMASKWHSRRKIITPAFHFKILEQFIEIFDNQSGILVKQIAKHSKTEKAFNIYPYVTLAALDVVSETAMGVKIHAQTDSNNVYVRAVSEITQIIMHRFSNNFLRVDFIFEIFAPQEKRQLEKAIKVVHDFTENVIQKRRITLKNELADKNTSENFEDDIGSKKKMPLLDVLLQSTINDEPLTNHDIREEVDTFMFEGHDTTTSGICYALYYISRYPDVQNKLIDEIFRIVGKDKETPVTYNDLQEMKYIECVLKESMRLHPPVPVIGREVTEDTFINGFGIPANTELLIPIFIMCRDPKIFPEPNKFDPDRHLPENTSEKSNPYAYIPFSAGPRNCIGQKFAMLEMKSTISKILRHYELLPLGEEPDPVVNLITKSTNGIHLGIRPRYY